MGDNFTTQLNDIKEVVKALRDAIESKRQRAEALVIDVEQQRVTPREFLAKKLSLHEETVLMAVLITTQQMKLMELVEQRYRDAGKPNG
jgi:hypothetical protein